MYFLSNDAVWITLDKFASWCNVIDGTLLPAAGVMDTKTVMEHTQTTLQK